MYAIGVGFIGKWALSPNRLVFWVSSSVCPITIFCLRYDSVVCGILEGGRNDDMGYICYCLNGINSHELELHG